MKLNRWIGVVVLAFLAIGMSWAQPAAPPTPKTVVIHAGPCST